MSSIFILPLDFVGMGTNVDGPIGEFGLSHDKLEIVLGHSGILDKEAFLDTSTLA
jgi:hypothetical protein